MSDPKNDSTQLKRRDFLLAGATTATAVALQTTRAGAESEEQALRRRCVLTPVPHSDGLTPQQRFTEHLMGVCCIGLGVGVQDAQTTPGFPRITEAAILACRELDYAYTWEDANRGMTPDVVRQSFERWSQIGFAAAEGTASKDIGRNDIVANYVPGDTEGTPTPPTGDRLATEIMGQRLFAAFGIGLQHDGVDLDHPRSVLGLVRRGRELSYFHVHDNLTAGSGDWERTARCARRCGSFAAYEAQQEGSEAALTENFDCAWNHLADHVRVLFKRWEEQKKRSGRTVSFHKAGACA